MVKKKISYHNNWKTPKELYSLLNNEFNFNFDPCPLNTNFNGIECEWGSSTFVNPPYGHELKLFVKKAFKEWKKGKNIVMLLPVRTDTSYFHKYIFPYAEIRFINGRLRFEGYATKNNEQINKEGKKLSNASFPTMLVIFNKDKSRRITNYDIKKINVDGGNQMDDEDNREQVEAEEQHYSNLAEREHEDKLK